MSQDYRIEMQKKEDAFMKKYKPMTLEVHVTYHVNLEPEEYAEYQNGKSIHHLTIGKTMVQNQKLHTNTQQNNSLRLHAPPFG